MPGPDAARGARIDARRPRWCFHPTTPLPLRDLALPIRPGSGPSPPRQAPRVPCRSPVSGRVAPGYLPRRSSGTWGRGLTAIRRSPTGTRRGSDFRRSAGDPCPPRTRAGWPAGRAVGILPRRLRHSASGPSASLPAPCRGAGGATAARRPDHRQDAGLDRLGQRRPRPDHRRQVGVGRHGFRQTGTTGSTTPLLGGIVSALLTRVYVSGARGLGPRGRRFKPCRPDLVCPRPSFGAVVLFPEGAGGGVQQHLAALLLRPDDDSVNVGACGTAPSHRVR